MEETADPPIIMGGRGKDKKGGIREKAGKCSPLVETADPPKGPSRPEREEA